MTFPILKNQSPIPKIEDKEESINPSTLISCQASSNSIKPPFDPFTNTKSSARLKEKLSDKNRNDKVSLNLLNKVSRKSGSSLKFHNFVANQDLAATNLPQTHCLREEHGTKQITVSNWRKDYPPSANNNNCGANSNDSKTFKTEIPKLTQSWPDSNICLQQEQSILESLLAKQDLNSNRNVPYSNRRKPLLVRRVLRSHESSIKCQNEPLDLSIKNKATNSEPCLVDANSAFFPSSSLDSIYLSKPILYSTSSKNANKSLPLSSSPNSVGKVIPTQSIVHSSSSSTSCSSSLSSYTCPSLVNHLPKLKTFHNEPHLVSSSTSSSSSNCPSSRCMSDVYITLTNAQQKVIKEKNAKRTVIRQKLEDAFRTNGFLVKTKQVSDGEATFCKFRQLRKYTRYYLKSWHQHLPEEVNKLWKGFLPPKTAKPSSSQQ